MAQGPRRPTGAIAGRAAPKRAKSNVGFEGGAGGGSQWWGGPPGRRDPQILVLLTTIMTSTSLASFHIPPHPHQQSPHDPPGATRLPPYSGMPSFIAPNHSTGPHHSPPLPPPLLSLPEGVRGTHIPLHTPLPTFRPPTLLHRSPMRQPPSISHTIIFSGGLSSTPPHPPYDPITLSLPFLLPTHSL